MLAKNLVPEETYWLLLLDVYSSHIDENMLAAVRLKFPTLIILFIPASCTPLLQACDVSFNAWFKRQIREFMANYMQSRMLQQLRAGVKPENVVIDTNLTNLKPVFTAAIASALNNVTAEVVKVSFGACGVPGTSFLFKYLFRSLCISEVDKYHHQVLLNSLASCGELIWQPISAIGKSKYAACIGGGGDGLNALRVSWPQGRPAAEAEEGEAVHEHVLMEADSDEEEDNDEQD